MFGTCDRTGCTERAAWTVHVKRTHGNETKDYCPTHANDRYEQAIRDTGTLFVSRDPLRQKEAA